MLAPPVLFLFAAIALAVAHLIHARLKKQKLPEGTRPLPGPKGEFLFYSRTTLSGRVNSRFADPSFQAFLSSVVFMMSLKRGHG